MNNSLSSVHPAAKIGHNVTISPFVFIEEDVEIGDGTWIGPHVSILKGSRIGKNCQLFPGCVIGAIPQDLKYQGEYTTAIIGDNTTLRECVTVNRGTSSRGMTVVGNNTLLMAYCHVGHDSIIGNNIIVSNATQFAGEVEVDDYAVISGGCLVHQFTKIGSYVMVQGGSKIVKDIPPYVMAGRDPVCFEGLNSIGLRRRGFSNDMILTIQDVYRIIYQSGLNTTAATQKAMTEIPDSPEKETILNFIIHSQRGIIRSAV